MSTRAFLNDTGREDGFRSLLISPYKALYCSAACELMTKPTDAEYPLKVIRSSSTIRPLLLTTSFGPRHDYNLEDTASETCSAKVRPCDSEERVYKGVCHWCGGVSRFFFAGFAGSFLKCIIAEEDGSVRLSCRARSKNGSVCWILHAFDVW